MSLECDLVTRPRHNQAQSGNHTPLKWLTEPLSSVLCLHLLYKPKSWGSAKILKNVDNYEWVTCSEQLRSGPGGLHYCSWPLWDSHQIQILLIFKARVKDASCAQYIMNRQEHFFVKKKTVELKCQIDLKTIIFAGIRHGDPQHFEPDSQS